MHISQIPRKILDGIIEMDEEFQGISSMEAYEELMRRDKILFQKLSSSMKKYEESITKCYDSSKS